MSTSLPPSPEKLPPPSRNRPGSGGARRRRRARTAGRLAATPSREELAAAVQLLADKWQVAL